jgi:hypothetical protein
MHGGAAGSGAPEGNENALNHGRYARGRITMRRDVRDVLRRARDLLRSIDD